jgi:hypothetical protein
MKKKLLQIIPGFLPDVDGLGDFARLLGNALLTERQIPTHFVVYRRPKNQASPPELPPNTISYPDEPTPNSLLRHLSELVETDSFEKAILHYGPYAYSKDGKPAAFAAAVQKFASRHDVLVFFHETYASAMPWKRAFWTRGEQEQAVKDILSASRTAFTSTSLVMRRLSRLNTAAVDIKQIRIFSNVGEPADLKPLSGRTLRLIVFGRLENRLQLYSQYRRTLNLLCKSMGITSIADVGVGTSNRIPKKIGNVEVQSLGFLDEQKMSALLADSLAGVLGYGPDWWEKSGVLAAYAAHAMLPILVPWNRSREQFLTTPIFLSSRNLASLKGPDGEISPEKMQEFATQAHDFYTTSQSLRRCIEIMSPYLDLK